MKTPDFIKAMRVRNLACVVANSHFVVDRVCKDAIEGKYMQQQLALLMSGDHQKDSQPLVNIVLNNNQAPSEDVDQMIINKLIDVQPDNYTIENNDKGKQE